MFDVWAIRPTLCNPWNPEETATDQCDWGNCHATATYVVAFGGQPPEGAYTAERRPLCSRHADMASGGWHIQGGTIPTYTQRFRVVPYERAS